MNTQFIIPGKPMGKQRPRMTKQGICYTPKETVSYENLVKMCFVEAGCQRLEGQIEAEIEAYYPIPKSMSKKDRERVHYGILYPTKKPDVDNIAKAILDSLNGIAYHDDSQVVSLTINKYYGEPKVWVKLTEVNYET